MNDIQIIEKLTKIKGIGEWTAQMLMIFNLGKLDVFPVGDFALRKNYSLFKSIPSPITMESYRKFLKNGNLLGQLQHGTFGDIKI